LQPLIEDLGSSADLSITVFDASGRVIADSTGNPDNYDNLADRAEVKEMLGSGKSRVTRYSPVIGTSVMFKAESLYDSEGKVVGYLRCGYSMRLLDEQLGKLRLSIFIGGLLMAFIALLPSYSLTGHFIKPLADMEEQARLFTISKIDTRIDIDRQDEIGQLSHVLENMYREVTDTLARVLIERTRLSGILGAINEGVIAVDSEELIIYINSTAAGIVGEDLENCFGRPIWEISRQPLINEAILETLHERVQGSREIRLVDKSGDLYYRIYTSPIITEEDETIGAAIILQDVTQIRKLADLRRDLVTNVSHEFRTPITAIMGITETLIENPDMDREQLQNFLARVMDQSQRLKSLSDDVLELSRIESKNSTGLHEPNDLREIVKHSVDSMNESAGRKNLELNFTSTDKKVMLRCDAHSILRVVDNLLDNSIKYTQEGGSVTVTVEKSGDRAILIVSDTGNGIEAKDLDRIFERFYRTGSARKPETPGTGLGLSIVKGIVDSYEGTIDVKSTPSSGTTVTVTLPLTHSD
jgi:two-component system phosphate regulon sensor histidine kinase PhoR